MSEVEKMYENVLNLKQKCSNPYIDPEYCAKDCKECKDFRYDYPPFTAEKQIELIKWLMCKKQTIQVELRLYENDFCISHITECEDNDAIEYVETGRKNTFDEALADLINALWQDLTDTDKVQIKEILIEQL